MQKGLKLKFKPIRFLKPYRFDAKTTQELKFL